MQDTSQIKRKSISIYAISNRFSQVPWLIEERLGKGKLGNKKMVVCFAKTCTKNENISQLKNICIILDYNKFIIKFCNFYSTQYFEKNPTAREDTHGATPTHNTRTVDLTRRYFRGLGTTGTHSIILNFHQN